MTEISGQPAVLALAWTLIHFVWQGALIGLVAFVLSRRTKRPATRYLVGVVALGVMLASAAATFAYAIDRVRSLRAAGDVARHVDVDVRHAESADAAATHAMSSAGGTTTPQAPIIGVSGTPLRPVDTPAASAIARAGDLFGTPMAAATVVAVWMLGVAMLSLRLTIACVMMRRLVHRAAWPVQEAIAIRARHVANRLSIRRAVTFLESAAVSVPMVVGWLKPVVLLPLASLANLSPAQLDALIAHELAHIRRHDAAVNLLQAAAETLLFYHPAVWWLSRQIRQDRERCCDDLAVAVCGDRLVYATALADLATQARNHALALSAADGVLVDRIRRVLGESGTSSWTGGAWLPLFVALVVAGVLAPIGATGTPPADAAPAHALVPRIITSSSNETPSVPERPALQPIAAVEPPAQAAPPPAPIERNAPRPMFRVRVVDAATNEPIEGVGVVVRCFPGPRTEFTNVQGVTNAQGEYVIDAGEPRVCIVMNTLKAGFIAEATSGTMRQNDVSPGETLRVVRLFPRGTIEGRVVDEDGRPIAKTSVRLANQGVSYVSTVTDEDGRFSFGEQAANAYTFMLPDLEWVSPAPVVVLQPGETRRDVELRGRRLPMFGVAGRLTDASGAALGGVQLFLDRADSPEANPANAATVQSDQDGRFEFTGVPRGGYRIRVDTGAPGVAGPGRLAFVNASWASLAVTVDHAIDGLSIVARPMPMVRGVVHFDGEASSIGQSALIGISAVSGPGGRSAGGGGTLRTDDNGRFSTTGLRPGRYLVYYTGIPSGWRFQSAMAGGRDISEVPFELTPDTPDVDVVITLTNRQTMIDGVVRTAAGQEDGEATVIAFSADSRFWEAFSPRRIVSVFSSRGGRYAIAGLAPGDYYLVAVSSSDELGVQPTTGRVAPALLPRLASIATRVHVEYDTPVTQELRRLDVRASDLR